MSGTSKIDINDYRKEKSQGKSHSHSVKLPECVGVVETKKELLRHCERMVKVELAKRLAKKWLK